MDNISKKILIADDEPDILEIIGFNLRKEGYEVYTARDGNEALEKAKEKMPQLIVLDIMMPFKTGIDVCRILRSQDAFDDTLIIFLTAVNDDVSHIRGLETGADDYVSKPVSPRVLVSRINALFRRTGKSLSEIAENKTLQADSITVDPVRFIVIAKDKEVVLAKKEFELLYLLIS